ncbi:MAG TPA: zinc-ribbon domain-containing protein [Smithellaceae bacterium]|nr:zinc-ribbon domain-containing protein [Smithellaceae bacterium]
MRKKVVKKKTNLQKTNPVLAAQWHPTRNGELTPGDVTPGSNKKVWWQCLRGHEWNTTVGNRNNGQGCPYCANQKVNHENCLLTVNPLLAMQWHPAKNGDLTPGDLTPYSNKKVWWQCAHGHEWNTTVSNRSNGQGCPYCVNQKVNKENCLQTVNPALAAEWHPTKNGDLTPGDVTPGSNKKVWWQCARGHEWSTTVNNRSNKHGCPHCYKLERTLYKKYKFKLRKIGYPYSEGKSN